ncbi:hypothetical protein [Paenibacillus sp. FSL H7-0326]|uniref:hypothetical protein n=1 Tax=Paenibacillus sp. FSL H7-0326 TaxID=1921144 RepID=UPI00117D1FB1|nr:hypothetical protein [Paenibacillus sp. FSL H7-0326]
MGEGNAVSQGETQTFEISGFSDSQPATEYELQKESTAIRHIPDPLNTRSNQGLFGDSPIIAPFGTLMSYSFYDLKPGHHIVSNSSFSVASPGSISLTLVQHYYPSVPPLGKRASWMRSIRAGKVMSYPL